jgi:hypothetical protein
LSSLSADETKNDYFRSFNNFCHATKLENSASVLHGKENILSLKQARRLSVVLYLRRPFVDTQITHRSNVNLSEVRSVP